MIYSSLKDTDASEILKYGKAKGVMQLYNILPAVCPFKTIKILTEPHDLKNIHPSKYCTYRQDLKIGSKNIKNISKSGSLESMKDYFEKIKKEDENCVLLVLETKFQIPPRNDSQGGFNVMINKGQNVVIELVGKGFDARELTNGAALHESYLIPWNEVLFCNKANKLRNYKIKQVCPYEYCVQRQFREDYLKKSGYTGITNENLPHDYVAPSNSFKERVLNEIVFPLFCKVEFLEINLSRHFWCTGNIGKNDMLIPFEISSAERVLEKPSKHDTKPNALSKFTQ